jgi:membrane protein DedA with SNARE-associated domain
LDWLIAHLEHFTYVGIALTLFLAGLGVPIPEDIPLIFGGAMAGAGKINVWAHLVISLVFILIGDTCLFFIGRHIAGATLSGAGRWGRLIKPERRDWIISHFKRHGSWTVFVARFVAGLRGGVFLTAGAAKFPYRRFLLLDGLAAMISVPVWVWLGHKFGENWEVLLEKAKHVQRGVLLAVVVAVVLGWLAWRVRRKHKAAQALASQPPGGHLWEEEDDEEGSEPEQRLAGRQAVSLAQPGHHHHELEERREQAANNGHRQ